MPYTKAHKDKTRERILESSFRLFVIKGFEGLTIDDLMNNCGLTRGGFYAHFKSKAELYSESIKFAANRSKLANLKPEHLSDQQWLCLLLDRYLSVEHVSGKNSCPLAFLATDINVKNEQANSAYINTFQRMNAAILEYAKSCTDCDEQDVLAVTAMIIGAVAIARKFQDQEAVEGLLKACRREAGAKLGGI